MTDLALPPALHAIPVTSTSSAAAAMAGELVEHVSAELPALAVLEDRDRLLAAAWSASLRSARTRRSYAGDLLAWRAWLAERGLALLGAGRVHVDLWVRAQQHGGARDASMRRRLSGIGSFYRYCLSHDLAAADPTAGVARPRVDPDYTATVGLSLEQGRGLIAAADADTGRARLRSAAVIRLLLRVDEALGADIAGEGQPAGEGRAHPRHPHRAAGLPGRPGRRRWPGGVAWDGRAVAGYHVRWADAAQPAVGAGAPAGRRGRDRRVGSALGALAAPMPASPWPSTRGSRCGTYRTTPGTATPAPPAGMTTPGIHWTGPRRMPSPPTSVPQAVGVGQRAASHLTSASLDPARAVLGGGGARPAACTTQPCTAELSAEVRDRGRDVEFCLGAADDGAEQAVEVDFSVRLLVGLHLPQHAVFQDCGQRLKRDRGVQMQRRDPASWLERFRTRARRDAAVTSGDA